MLPLESFADFTAAGNGGNADGSSANDTVNTVKSDTAGGTESAESE